MNTLKDVAYYWVLFFGAFVLASCEQREDTAVSSDDKNVSVKKVSEAETASEPTEKDIRNFFQKDCPPFLEIEEIRYKSFIDHSPSVQSGRISAGIKVKLLQDVYLKPSDPHVDAYLKEVHGLERKDFLTKTGMFSGLQTRLPKCVFFLGSGQVLDIPFDLSANLNVDGWTINYMARTLGEVGSLMVLATEGVPKGYFRIDSPQMEALFERVAEEKKQEAQKESPQALFEKEVEKLTTSLQKYIKKNNVYRSQFADEKTIIMDFKLYPQSNFVSTGSKDWLYDGYFSMGIEVDFFEPNSDDYINRAKGKATYFVGKMNGDLSNPMVSKLKLEIKREDTGKYATLGIYDWDGKSLVLNYNQEVKMALIE